MPLIINGMVYAVLFSTAMCLKLSVSFSFSFYFFVFFFLLCVCVCFLFVCLFVCFFLICCFWFSLRYTFIFLFIMLEPPKCGESNGRGGGERSTCDTV